MTSEREALASRKEGCDAGRCEEGDAGEVEPQVAATARLQLMQGLFEHEDC